MNDSPPGTRSKGPFRCHNCNRVLGWREIKAGQCQGHLLSEVMSEFVACEVRDGVATEVKEVAARHMMDRKYNRDGWGHFDQKHQLWVP